MKKSPRARPTKSDLKSNRQLVVIIGIALIVSTGVFAILELSGTTNLFNNEQSPAGSSANLSTTESNIYKPATEQEKQEVEDRKLANDQSSPSTPTAANKAVILSAEQLGGIDSVVVKTQLFGSGWKGCKLTLTKDSLVVSKTSDALYQADYSTCLGFSVPVDELSQSGLWKVSLTATKNDGSTFNAEIKTVNVTK